MWGHIADEFNPSDISTRGMTALKISKSNLWWHGPVFLGLASEFKPYLQQIFIEQQICNHHIPAHCLNNQVAIDILLTGARIHFLAKTSRCQPFDLPFSKSQLNETMAF